MQKKEQYLVATSGGPDSTYLVHWLWRHGYKNLILAHVNYHWREDSNRDQRIVEALAKKFNLPLEVKSIAAHKEKPNSENFESWARNQRYDFFASLKTKYPFSTVVVGHQENDLIETFLMQQERQSMVKHYGLAPTTHHHNLKIWRPLLTRKKSEILQWLDDHDVTYAVDSTNNDVTLQRNRIRHQLKESEFAKIHQVIRFFNQENQKQNNLAKHYIAKNQRDNGLLLANELGLWDQEKLQRLIYLFLQQQQIELQLGGRKKQMVKEIAKRLTKSDKNFWAINFGNQLLIKDYNVLRVLHTETLPPATTVVKTKSDFAKLQKFLNKEQIISTIGTDNYQFPYEIWTLNPERIKGQKWGSKSLQTLLGKQKFSYEKRFKTGVIYHPAQKKLLHLWQW